MALGTAHPCRIAEPNTQEVVASFTGAGAANCTKVDGDGVSSLAYNAATGEFILTFTDVGVTILYCDIQCHTANNTGPTLGKIIPSTFSISAKTVDVEFWDTATPSKINPASGDLVHVRVIFKKTT